MLSDEKIRFARTNSSSGNPALRANTTWTTAKNGVVPDTTSNLSNLKYHLHGVQVNLTIYIERLKSED